MSKSSPTPSRLQPGEAAPDFEIHAFDGRPLRLSACRGQPVLLSFFRYASCPMCNLRVRDLIAAHERFTARGLVHWAVFESTPENMARYVGRQAPPFALVPDTTGHLYRLYGVERSLLGTVAPSVIRHAAQAMGQGMLPGRVDGKTDRMPADFLIDARGQVSRAFYAATADAHLPLAEIDAWLSAQPAAPAGLAA